MIVFLCFLLLAIAVIYWINKVEYVATVIFGCGLLFVIVISYLFIGMSMARPVYVQDKVEYTIYETAEHPFVINGQEDTITVLVDKDGKQEFLDIPRDNVTFKKTTQQPYIEADVEIAQDTTTWEKIVFSRGIGDFDDLLIKKAVVYLPE